jgi:hypothetical protein
MNALNKTLIAQNTSKEISLSLPCELKAAYPLSSTLPNKLLNIVKPFKIYFQAKIHD